MRTTKWVAIAPKKGEIASYLTNGKQYDIISFDEKDGKIIIIKGHGRLFAIDSGETDGGLCYCLEFYCPHLHGGNWKIKRVEAVTA